MPETTEPTYGAPAALFEALEKRGRPPGPLFRSRIWRSPLRGPWLTSVFGFILLWGLPVLIVTGLLSYLAYQPQFAGNAFPHDVHGLRLPYFDWPTNPSWLYRLNQGLHVGLGLVLVPVVLAKLWSVIPKLFAWPPARSFAQLLERASLALLVGSILFELATGVLNIQYDYVFGFDFYTAHYYGAWVFIGSFALHVGLKLPTMRRSLKTRRLRDELRVPLAETVPEPPDEHGLVATDPADPTMSRRGLLGVVAGASALVGTVTLGQTIGWRPSALLSARGPVVRRRADRLPGQPHGPGRADHASRHQPLLAARGGRHRHGLPQPRGAARAAAAHRRSADRLRRGVVHGADLDRGAAARPSGASGRA